MAVQLIADLRGCDVGVLDDQEKIAQVARDVVASIGGSVIEECVHKFEPIGVSYIAVISTSHFSVHTWPEYGYAAVDVFSCSDGVPSLIADALQEAFGAAEVTTRVIERAIEGGFGGQAGAADSEAGGTSAASAADETPGRSIMSNSSNISGELNKASEGR